MSPAGTLMILTGVVLLASILLRSRKNVESGPVYPVDVPRMVVALGDSLTAHGGYCTSLESSLPPGSLVTCQGYVGFGAKVISSHVTEAVADGPTDVVILAGVNDLAAGRSTSHVMIYLEHIYSVVRDSGARVVGVGLTPWTGHSKGGKLQSETAEINAWIAAHPLVDAYVDPRDLGDSQGYLHPGYSSDGLHLSVEGQWALGQLIAEQAFGG